MPRPQRTRPVSAPQARAYAAKAQLDAARHELEANRRIAATSLAIHAAINAADRSADRDAVVGEVGPDLRRGPPSRTRDGRGRRRSRPVAAALATSPAASEICAALNLAAGAAVFCVEQLIEDRGRPAGWHRVHVRPERYRCVVRWDPSAAG